jgi:hypothetical protein
LIANLLVAAITVPARTLNPAVRWLTTDASEDAQALAANLLVAAITVPARTLNPAVRWLTRNLRDSDALDAKQKDE